MTRLPFVPLALCLALGTLAASTAFAAAPRGPSTPEERAKAVELVKVTETEPWSDQAKDARAWLKQWLTDIPDIVVKSCPSLIGPPPDRQGVPADLMDQITYSGTAYLIEHPDAGPGSTPTLTYALEHTLRTYEAMRKHGAPEVKRMETLLGFEKSGELVGYVRAAARGCI